jgi:hypothetical protein
VVRLAVRCLRKNCSFGGNIWKNPRQHLLVAYCSVPNNPCHYMDLYAQIGLLILFIEAELLMLILVPNASSRYRLQFMNFIPLSWICLFCCIYLILLSRCNLILVLVCF